eukprot:1633663-Amphidinium_carterae.1
MIWGLGGAGEYWRFTTIGDKTRDDTAVWDAVEAPTNIKVLSPGLFLTCLLEQLSRMLSLDVSQQEQRNTLM